MKTLRALTRASLTCRSNIGIPPAPKAFGFLQARAYAQLGVLCKRYITMSITPALRSEVIRLGGDPTDLTWDWFLFRGPHGNSFTWSRTRKEPPGYIGFEHLKEIIAELSSANPDFISHAHAIARAALHSIYPNVVRRGIQVIAVIGDISDLQKIEALLKHDNELIVRDAKACIFELKKILRQRK